MTQKSIACVLVGLALSAAAGDGASAARGASGDLLPAYNPKVGRVHPDFTLPTVDSFQPMSLSQFRGKKVLLIHMASW